MSAGGSVHSFHIPVMGTGFTIDTPLRVARYGISSVISLVDDELVEQMRKFHAEREGEPFEPIEEREDDYRARRITAYLNMVNKLVARQVRDLQASPFEPGSEITRYFELLPESDLKADYEAMLAESDPVDKLRRQQALRPRALPGSIDGNIMTKLDRDAYKGNEKLPPEFSDAQAALRGFALSDVRGSLILSAGLNQRLYSYMGQFQDFLPTTDGELRKKIILKVSDYRSAIIQGKFLAKKGLWVSEYRVESGLNCGGHAFASVGNLMGPILDEFRRERDTLQSTLHEVLVKALAAAGRPVPAAPMPARITVQGGVGTSCEHELLLKYYAVDAVGWATPFLLVPEVTNVDPVHLERLQQATEKDVYLSPSSPLGIPFWSLKTSTSEEVRKQRIAEGKPGSHCPKGYLISNTEFTQKPICTASFTFQRRKLKEINANGHSSEDLDAAADAVTIKACICHDLAGGATLKHGIDPFATTSICCGPNIVNFSKIATLEEMIGHIYGRLSLLTNPDRPHMFLRELKLYIDYMRKEAEEYSRQVSAKTPKYFQEFRENLTIGIDHYRQLAEIFIDGKKSKFLSELNALQHELEQLIIPELAAQGAG